MSNIEVKTKTLSAHLQELIDVANKSIQTIKEQILEIYETAKTEGFTAEEARALIEVKVIRVSKGYLRQVLPEEAKESKFANKKKTHKFDTEDFDEDEDDDEEDEAQLVTPNKVPNIPPPKQEIKEAETTEVKEWDLPEPEDSINDTAVTAAAEANEPDTHEETKALQEYVEYKKLQREIENLKRENTQLRMEKVGTFGNKFDFEYDYEMPSGSIVPFIVTCFPDKKTGYIRLNKDKIAADEEKERKKQK